MSTLTNKALETGLALKAFDVPA